MKFSGFYHFLLSLSFILLPLSGTQSVLAADAPSAIGFQFCSGDNCPQSAIRFSGCGENAKNDGGQCVCLDGFVGDGHVCLKTKCTDGTYSVITNGAEKCEICPPGNFCENGIKKQCPEGLISDEGATRCDACPNGHYAINGTNTCCSSGQTFDKVQNKCIPCEQGQSCQCPRDLPYANGKGECVACLADEDCPTGFCSNNTCCPQHSSTLIKNGEPLANGCFCQSGYEPSEDGTICVETECSQVEHSSPTGKGDQTSIETCFCNTTHPHWQNGRCMRAKNCSVLMEHYGFRKGLDFEDDYTLNDQKFLNAIHITGSFQTPSDMNLTGCNLVIDGNFTNKHKLIVDSLFINFSDFTYHDNGTAENIGIISTKGLTASKFINNGTIYAPQANVNFGYFENRGILYADGIYELNGSPSIVKNLGTMTITNDFLFGSMAQTGSVQNSGKIVVGGDWDSNNVYNWNKIVVHKTMNRDNIKVSDEGTIVVENHE